MLYPARPIKFSQGDGTLNVNIPLPPTSPIAPISVPTSAPTSAPVTDAPTPAINAIQAFVLKDVVTLTEYAMSNLMTINFAQIGTKALTIIVLTRTYTGIRIEFNWTDAGVAKKRVENTAPWTMGGDSGSAFTPVAYLGVVGSKAVTAIAYSTTSGVLVGSSTIQFTVINETVATTPVISPTQAPKAPTKAPTKVPTLSSTEAPRAPTKTPTRSPTKAPTKAPTRSPTKAPTRSPTKAPTRKPTQAPVKPPTNAPIGTSTNSFTSFVLKDVSTLKEYLLSPSMTFSLSTIGTNPLTLLAKTSSNSGIKVQFKWQEENGTNQSRLEGTAPWAMGGDTGGTTFSPVPFLKRVGTKSINISALSSSTGSIVFSATVNFNVVQ
jgi:hypothetical protein